MARKYRYLTYEDRKRLEEMHNSGMRAAEIAKELDVMQSTIYRELKTGYTGELLRDYRLEYSADLAQFAYTEAMRRKGRKRKEPEHGKPDDS